MFQYHKKVAVVQEMLHTVPEGCKIELVFLAAKPSGNASKRGNRIRKSSAALSRDSLICGKSQCP
jgi:hypothetical protein